MSKTVTIFGATGNQGGSVVRAILADPVLSKTYKIRGVARDHSKPAAQELKQQGVELVTADLNSKESLTAALRGSDSVFLVTNFWESGKADVEKTQGQHVADVAAELGVPQLIFSSLIDVTKTTDGKLTGVTHFDSKAHVEDYIRSKGLQYTAFVMPGYYMSNFKMSMRKTDDESYGLAFPVSLDAQFPLIDISRDLGKFVLPALHDPAGSNGKQFLAAQDYYPLRRLISEFEETTGKKVNFNQVPNDVYRSFMPPNMAEEMLENHLLIQDPGYYGGASLADSIKAVDATGATLTTWKDYLKTAGF